MKPQNAACGDVTLLEDIEDIAADSELQNTGRGRQNKSYVVPRVLKRARSQQDSTVLPECDSIIPG